MQLNVIERPQKAAEALPHNLLELVGRARRSIDVDPGLTRRCLEEISSLLSCLGGTAPDRLALRAEAALPSMVAKGGLATWQLKRVKLYVEENLDDTILIEDLAEITNLSPGHFCRAFKASTRETPHGYIVRQRIGRAQSLMLNTNDTLSQIACACGLTDQAHLTRLFRRILNETPLTWRRNWREA